MNKRKFIDEAREEIITKEISLSLPYKKTQIFVIILLCFLLNYIAIHNAGIEELKMVVSDLNVDRPGALFFLYKSILSIIPIIFYVVFALIIFRFVYYFVFFNDQLIKKRLSDGLLLFILYGYLFVAIWNILNQYYLINNPIILSIFLSNILSYIVIGLLLYQFVISNIKVFIAPISLIFILAIINTVVEN